MSMSEIRLNVSQHSVDGVKGATSLLQESRSPTFHIPPGDEGSSGRTVCTVACPPIAPD